MTSTQAQALILQDETGACYAVPLELLAQCRLPDAVAAQLCDSDEVSGYLLPAVFRPLGVAAILGGSSFGTGVTADRGSAFRLEGNILVSLGQVGTA